MQLRRYFFEQTSLQPSFSQCWSPHADVYRTQGGCWLIKLDLAGVRLEDVQVSLEGSILRVSGVRKDQLVEIGCHHYSLEISYNQFERSIEFPETIENGVVDLQYQDGMLLISIQVGA